MYYCAQDVIDYLMQSVGGGAQDQEHRVLRAAVHHSYRDVSHAKDWLWYVTESSVTVASGDNTYLLPVDCVNIDALIPPDRTTLTSYITPAEWVRREQDLWTLGEALYWTVTKSTDPKNFDRWELKIGGRVPDGMTLRYTYRRRPRPLTLMGYETQVRTGFVSVNGSTVSGTSTNFPGRCVGAVLRIGTPQNHPEPLSGFYPYQEQGRIAVRDSGSSLVLENPMSESYSSCRFVISDLLDVSPGMFTAVLTGAEVWVARMLGKPIEAAVGLYTRDLKLAMEQDVIAPISGRRAPYDRVPDSIQTPYAGVYTAPLGPDGGA